MQFLDTLRALMLHAANNPTMQTPRNTLRQYLHNHADEIAAVVEAADEVEQAFKLPTLRKALNALEAKS